MSTLKVVIHSPSEASYKRARNNARNLLARVPEAQIEIVVNAAAATNAVAETEDDILAMLMLCRNSLDAQSLTPPAGVQIVAAAVEHLVRRQQEGWSYIRA